MTPRTWRPPPTLWCSATATPASWRAFSVSKVFESLPELSQFYPTNHLFPIQFIWMFGTAHPPLPVRQNFLPPSRKKTPSRSNFPPSWNLTILSLKIYSIQFPRTLVSCLICQLDRIIQYFPASAVCSTDLIVSKLCIPRKYN